jgi:hypothetical protein
VIRHSLAPPLSGSEDRLSRLAIERHGGPEFLTGLEIKSAHLLPLIIPEFVGHTRLVYGDGGTAGWPVYLKSLVIAFLGGS